MEKRVVGEKWRVYTHSLGGVWVVVLQSLPRLVLNHQLNQNLQFFKFSRLNEHARQKEERSGPQVLDWLHEHHLWVDFVKCRFLGTTLRFWFTESRGCVDWVTLGSSVRRRESGGNCTLQWVQNKAERGGAGFSRAKRPHAGPGARETSCPQEDPNLVGRQDKAVWN